MNSSSSRKQGSRRSSPVAEFLEGRQLLSTMTMTTAAAVSAPPVDPSGFALPGIEFGGGRMHGGQSGGFGGGGKMPGFGGSSISTTVAVSATSSSAVPSTTTPTPSSTTTAAPTTSAPAGSTLPWAGGLFGLRDGFGGSFGLSNFAGAIASSETGDASASTPNTGAMSMSPFAGQIRGGWGGTGSTTSTTSDMTPILSTYAKAEQTAFQQLQTDEQAIHDKSQVTPALQAAFRNDLTALAKEITQAPSATTVLALKSDLATVVGTLPTSDQLTTIQTDFTAVLTSAGVTDSTGVTKTFGDLSAVLNATSIGTGDISTLTTDLKAAGLSTTNPLTDVDLGVNLDSLLSTVVIAGSKATATSSTSTTSTPTTTTGTTTSTS